MRKLRILHIMTGSDAGGLSRYVHDIATATYQFGHDVVVAGQRGVSHGLFKASPFPWIDIPLQGGPMALYRSATTLRRYIKGNPVDLLHTHYRRGTLLGRLLRLGHPTPLLYTLHLSHVDLRWPARLFADFGEHTHVASIDACQWLVDDANVARDKITVIPHGIEVAQFPQRSQEQRQAARAFLGLPPHALIGAYVGRFQRVKNVPWMLDVAFETRRSIPDLHILLVGGGPDMVFLRRLITERSLGDRVTLLDHREPLQIYQAADAVLLPSQREGFSLVAGEAMCVGLPVLRTRTSGTTELIVEGVTGQSTAIERSAFVTGAIAFLSDRQKLREMGAAAAAHVRHRFTFQRQVQETMALYDRLTQAQSPSDSLEEGA